MKTIKLIVAFVFVWPACFAAAQVQISHPEQFYTNGKKIDGWTRDPDRHFRLTFWFVKHPENSLSYQQQIVIVYDSDPNKAYYFDSTTKEFIGRFDFQSGQYSLLRKEDRRKSIEEINDARFPPPGELPTIGEMFESVTLGVPASRTKMMTPPPTAQFPRLDNSSWDTNYTTANGERTRATLEFHGDSGTYRLINSDTIGELSNIKYNSGKDAVSVEGKWSHKGGKGCFIFSIPKDNMDVLWGGWGVKCDSIIYGTWDGIRKPR